MRSLLLALAFGLVSCLYAFSEDGNCTVHDPATRPECPQAIAFYQKIRTAILGNDQPAVLRLVSLPLNTSLHGRRTVIRSPAVLRTHYSEIFNARIHCALKRSNTRAVWGNSHGFTIEDGALWFDLLLPPGITYDPQSPTQPAQRSFRIFNVNSDAPLEGCP